MLTKLLRITAPCLAAGVLCSAQLEAQQFGGGQGNQNRGGGAGAGGSRVYTPTGEVGEAIVTSDPETRRLIVITDEETSEHVKQVITNLDVPKPQVLISVVFLEVTYANNLDFGIESSTRKALNDSTSLFATNTFGGLASQGAANSFGVPGAGIYQIANNDLQVTLRAVAANGKLEVLSKPTILARNNQQANILVGQQVPLVSNVRYDTIGNQINTVTYQDVGIILRVTPFITSDGLVEMIVAPEISALDRSQSIQISPGVVAPVINKRSADTVVVTAHGQPVMIGGLMENNKSQTDSKVPLLGDIPGLGWLFKRTNRGGTKTELIIFLTPYVVNDVAQLRSVSQREANKAIYAPNAFSEEELNRFLEGMPLNRTPEPKKKKK